MNKIALLKLLIAGITFLIFLALGGIAYALINYKTTPKLISRKKAPVSQSAEVQTAPDQIPEISLKLKDGESIAESHPCGDLLCLKITSDFAGSKVLIFDPVSLKIKAVLTK